jgi:hypothetical protein
MITIGGGVGYQAVQPDETAQLGTSGAELTVPTGASVESLPAPQDGLGVLFIPAGLVVRMRVAVKAPIEATATDQAYAGAAVHYIPLRQGQVVSLYGDGGGGVVTLSMGR